MEIVINLALFILGLIIIIKGSDLFLDSAVWIANAYGVPQIIIGATIVSLCTTLPELVSSVTASLDGAVEMALGNAVGSIICNTGMILGFMLLFITARAAKEMFLVKGTFMVVSVLMALFLAWPASQGEVSILTRADGVVLLLFLVVFLVVNFYESLHVETTEEEEEAELVNKKDWPRHLVLFLVGAVAVGVGAVLLVKFGRKLAVNIGISEAVISLIFIAFGTSLPELFTAISAIRKKAEQISVGNIFGANVLNIALVTGTSSAINPITFSDKWLMTLDIPAALVICTVAFFGGLIRGRVGRKTGILLIVLYVAYTVTRLILAKS